MTLRFLLLEDNRDDAELIQTTLLDGGIDCEVLRVESRSSFITALETYKFDLIVADYALPSFDGFSVLKIARNLRPNLPLIFVSDSRGEELAIETLKRGATDYVLKQRLGRLVPSVERALREAQEGCELKQAELILVEQKRLLELIALGHPLEECLYAVCASVSKLSPSTRACFLLTDTQRATFPCSITPDFPPSFGEGLKDAPINDLCIGTCGEAVYRGKPITCSDLANDECWSQEWRNLCIAHGILACHSKPVIGFGEQPFGSLMLCFDEARMPTQWEHKLAEFSTQVASIVFERERTSLARRESEQRLRKAISIETVGIVFFKTDGSIIDANDAFLGMNGYSRKDLAQGRVRWDEMTPTEWMPHSLKAIEEFQSLGYTTPYEKEYIRKNGTRWWGLFAATRLNEDEGVEFIIDITDKKRTQEALRESEELKQRILESSDDCIKVLTLDGQILYISKGGLNLLEIDEPTSCLNTNWFNFWPEEDREKVKEALAAAKAGKTGRFQGYCPSRKNCPKWWDSIITPIRDASGIVTQLVVISRDITQQKQVQEERARLLASEQAAREQAETANRVKDEFLAVLSHELRSPLNPILGWSQLLRSGKLNALQTAQGLETIERNAKLQTQLIEDLLDISRIVRGKLILNISPVDLAIPITAALETVQLAAQAKGIEIQRSIPSKMAYISGDSSRLQQIVWNLLSNAVKFTPSQGRVEVRLEREGSEALIQVKDTGKGINQEFLPHVFDYFRQENSRTTRQFGGLGLGLALVRQLTELHGGTVTVESSGKGQGATFTVRLPLLKNQSTLMKDETNNSSLVAPDAPLLTGVRILVVDDEADTRDLANAILSSVGASVVVAQSAAEALLIFDSFKPEILLSDIGMPQMDGYMLMRQVRALPPEQGGQIPAIALSAYAGEIDEQQAMSAGFQKHIPKPVEPDLLVEAIANLVKQIESCYF